MAEWYTSACSCFIGQKYHETTWPSEVQFIREFSFARGFRAPIAEGWFGYTWDLYRLLPGYVQHFRPSSELCCLCNVYVNCNMFVGIRQYLVVLPDCECVFFYIQVNLLFYFNLHSLLFFFLM